METKKKIRSLMIAAVALGFIWSGCAAPSEKDNEGGDETEETNQGEDEAFQIEVEDYKEEASGQISENEGILQDFRDRIEDMQQDAKENYERQIANFEERNENLKTRINDFRAERREAWEEFKTEFSNDMKDLGEALKNFTIESEN